MERWNGCNDVGDSPSEGLACVAMRASKARRPPRDDPVIVRRVRLCVSLGGVCENGVIVYLDHIFDCSGPLVRIDKPI